MLLGTIAPERFEPVPRWDTEVFESSRDLQLSKLAPSDGLDIYELSCLSDKPDSVGEFQLLICNYFYKR